MPWGAVAGAAISAAGSAASSGKGKKASKSAAGQQQAAQQQALQLYQNNLGTAQQTVAPFIQAGQQGIEALQNAIPGLSQPFQPTEAQLQATPGYQFALDQGLKATQNGFAAKGLASSGPAMAGAGAFATGLADQTYGNQFNRYWQQNQNIANMLNLPVASSLQATSPYLQALLGMTQGGAGAITGAGNAGAAGTLGAAGQGQNGIMGGLGAISQLFQPGANGRTPLGQLFNPGGTTPPPSSPGVTPTPVNDPNLGPGPNGTV